MIFSYLHLKNNLLQKKNYLLIIQITAFVVFAGRAYQHLFWDGPYRSVFWDQELLEGTVNALLNMDWNEFVTSQKINDRIQLFIRSVGVIFTLSATSVFAINKYRKVSLWIISIGTFFIVMLAFASFKTKFYQIGEWFEYGVQIGSPIVLMLYVTKKASLQNIVLLAKVAIAITFVGHGFYAFGYYPQPGGYVDMMINITGLGEDFIRPFLKVMGFLDFVIAVLLFIPKTARPALMYCVIWGLLTAMARVVSYFDFTFALDTLHQWLFQTVFRLSHGLLPLWAFIVSSKNSES